MFCKNCGKELNQTAKFCDSCGTQISGNYLVKNISLWEGYVSAFKNYAKTNGRARRKEYWGFNLFYYIVLIGISFLVGLICGIADVNETEAVNVVTTLYALSMVMPNIAVSVRRLHDIGKSGWNFLWIFTIIGAIPFLIWVCRDSQSGENKYGVNPKETLDATGEN